MRAEHKTLDTLLHLKDAGLVAVSAAATVDSVAKVVSVGSGVVKGEMVIDVTAIEIASNDERYTIILQGSTKSDFADTFVDLAILDLGALEVLAGDQDSTIGRYVVPFSNVQDETVYPYLRLYTVVAGTVATGINYKAYLAKR